MIGKKNAYFGYKIEVFFSSEAFFETGFSFNDANRLIY